MFGFVMKKPPKPVKPAEKRQSEVESMMEKFLELELPLEHPGVQEFLKATREYSEKAIGSSGIIRFNEFNRVMQYILSVQPHVESRMLIDYTGKKPKVTVANDQAL